MSERTWKNCESCGDQIKSEASLLCIKCQLQRYQLEESKKWRGIRDTKVEPKRKLVTYTVKFKCSVTIKEGEDEQDALCDIDIPEGGINDSVYCEGSFRIIDWEEAPVNE